MELRRRVFISSPRDKYLSPEKIEAKQRIIDMVEGLGYEAQVFNPETGGSGMARGLSWNIQQAQIIMEKCVGAILIGFEFWRNCLRVDLVEKEPENTCSLVTEYCQFEGALAKDLGIPILSLLENGVSERLVFMGYSGDTVVSFPSKNMIAYFEGENFREVLDAWHERVEQRYDLFTGYCSRAGTIAKKINGKLNEQFKGIRVLDWKDHFTLGDTIINQIEIASKLCTSAIFIFSKDDEIKSGKNPKTGNKYIPRDNVIFELGYFMRARPHAKVLLFVEEGTKIPADLGGVIYVRLSGTSQDDEMISSALNQAIPEIIVIGQ